MYNRSMQIIKKVPTWSIIADTKINNQSFTTYHTSVSNSFEIDWLKANGKALQTSNAEKILEVMAYDLLGLKNDKNLPNDKFLELHAKALEPLYDHFSVTIVFNNVSHIFLQNIILEKLGNYHISQKRLTDLSLWCPPVFESSAVQNIYGGLVGNIFNSIEEFVSKAKLNGVSEQQALDTSLSMMPRCQQSRVIFTSSFSSLRTMLLRLSDFERDEETRFIMLHLLRDLKARYLSFFSDLVLEKKDKKQFGSDSLNNEGFWKLVKVNKRL